MAPGRQIDGDLCLHFAFVRFHLKPWYNPWMCDVTSSLTAKFRAEALAERVHLHILSDSKWHHRFNHSTWPTAESTVRTCTEILWLNNTNPILVR